MGGTNWVAGGIKGEFLISVFITQHHLLNVVMPKYPEIHSYVIDQIRREMDFLNSSIVRMKHCLAIICTLSPEKLDYHQHWLWTVDWI